MIGTADGLRTAKNKAIADLGAIVHNNFATQADIDAAVATIDDITADFTASLTLVQINVDIAVNTADGLEDTISRTEFEISEIEFAARDAQRDAVQESREYYGRILTSLSLAFEGALALSAALSEVTILAEERQTGTMLDFIA